jgi:hypothetical protein
MRILFVAMVNSVHTARWINLFVDQGWDIHLFPSVEVNLIHPTLKNITIHDFCYFPQGPFFHRPETDNNVHLVGGIKWHLPRGSGLVNRLLHLIKKVVLKSSLSDRSKRLSRVIRLVKPDIIHSLETQQAGYLLFAARQRNTENFPCWIHTPWGSDIYLFGRLTEHRDKIRAVLSVCDYYQSESERDIELAKKFGFKGKIVPIMPGNGGYNISRIFTFRQPGLTSERRLILLKGYQGWAGRALCGLCAIRLAAPFLTGYRVGVYLANDDVKMAVELTALDTGLTIDIIPHCSHDEMLKWHGQARISLGVSISDGVPNSMLEAMAMGSFPIQSENSCADEWIVNGENGLIVPPENPDEIAAAIRQAIVDDALVDRAAVINSNLIQERANADKIKFQAISMYQEIVDAKLRRGFHFS